LALQSLFLLIFAIFSAREKKGKYEANIGREYPHRQFYLMAGIVADLGFFIYFLVQVVLFKSQTCAPPNPSLPLNDLTTQWDTLPRVVQGAFGAFL
jgi:hypothetical protein